MHAVCVIALGLATAFQAPPASAPSINPAGIIVKPNNKAATRPQGAAAKTLHAGESKPNSSTYRVDILPHPFDWRDALYVIYIIATSVAAFVAWRALRAIQGQSNILGKQVAAMNDQLAEMRTAREQTIEQMRGAADQTRDIVKQGAAQVAALNITANIAQETAKAAKASADALVNSERAWVIPELQCAATLVGARWWSRDMKATLTGEDVIAGKHLIYSLKLTNMGRTPAQVLSFRINYTCLPEGVRDLTPTTHIDLALQTDFIKLLDARKSIELSDPTIDVRDYINRNGDAIRKLKKTAVIWGWVKYRHMFSTAKSCYADFCYVYTVSQDRLTSVGRHTGQREQIDEPGGTKASPVAAGR